MAIAVSSQAEWQALFRVVEHPDLCKENKYSDSENLQKNHDELEKIIETCTLHLTHYKATQLLQEAGVRTGVICKPPNSLPMNICGQDFFPGNRIALKWAPENIAACQSNFQVNLFLHAGTSYLNQHEEYIMEKLLGLSKEEIDQFIEKNIIGKIPN